MRRISPVPTSDHAGFTLVEVIVAMGVTAILCAAAASAVLVSGKLRRGAEFTLKATTTAGWVQAGEQGIYRDSDSSRPDFPVEVVSEAIKPKSDADPAWTLHLLTARDAARSVRFCTSARP